MGEGKLEKNEDLSGFSRELRRGMTKEEKHLWYDFLKLLPVTVNRQKIIGNYIVDFFCASAKTVIELDGSQHYEDEAIGYDRKRDEYMRDLGLTVLRYTDHEINHNFAGVCKDIKNHFGIE